MVLQALAFTSGIQSVSPMITYEAHSPHEVDISVLCNRWIHSVARIDPGLLQLLRYARKGEWAYGKMPVTEHARQLGPDLCRGVGVAPELGMPDRVSVSVYTVHNIS